MRVSIASGKGGTGKTILSTNLAAFLSKEKQVALVDLDVEAPNSHIFINGNNLGEQTIFKQIPSWDASACSLCGECQQNCAFNAILKLKDEIILFPQLCHSCYACSELCPTGSLPMQDSPIGLLKFANDGNLIHVDSRLNIGEEQAVPLIRKTIDIASVDLPDSEFVLYDCPPGTSCPVIEATRDADFVILITEPTPFGLHDLQLAVATMRVLEKDMGVVINRDGIGNQAVEEYCVREEIPIMAKIPYNQKVAEAYSKGLLVYKAIPEFEKALQQIEDYLIEITKKR